MVPSRSAAIFLNSDPLGGGSARPHCPGRGGRLPAPSLHPHLPPKPSPQRGLCAFPRPEQPLSRINF